MYNDGVITNEFTGYYDGVEQKWVYPTAEQDAVIEFANFYLSAADGDLTADGLSIHYTGGSSEDLTVGNATSAVLSATMMNPDGLMEGLTWGDGTAYIGVATASNTYTVSSGTLFYIVDGSCAVRVTATTAYKTYGGTTRSVTLSGTPTGVLMTGTTANVYCDNGKLYYCNYNAASWSNTTVPPNNFLATKYMNFHCAVKRQSSTLPLARWTVEGTTATEVQYTYVPMGVFDFSNVDAFGITFQVEAYDKMTLFDADATDWVNNLDFTSPKTISGIISELMTKMGMTATISASAVNTSVSWSSNPINSYSVTYRQVLSWLAEAIGCNVRMGRTGDVEFYVYGGASVATITPDTIISNTRTKSRYTVPAITQVVSYNTLGAGYSYGSDGSTYYVVGNPFVDASGGTTPLQNLKNLLDDVAAYNATTLGVACADPRYDIGDTLTITDTDGSTTYNIPLMEYSVYFGGGTRSEIVATGRQVRGIPDSMQSTNLASEVNSNPSAVVNMIEAHGISADAITTGKLTVKDSNDDVLFEADKDTKKVDIAGFEVSSSGFTSTEVGHYHINIAPSGVVTITDNDIGDEMTLGAEGISVDDLVYPSNHSDLTASGAYSTDGSNEAYFESGYVELTSGGGSDSKLTAADLTISNGSNSTTTGITSYAVTDGTNTATLSKDSLVFDDGDEAPILGVYKLFHNSTSTATATYTKTLPSGAYLLVHFRNGAPTTASTGLQIMVIGTSAYATVITMTGSGANIGAASGTRSHVAVTSNGDGTGTVTWTVEGLSYRKLLMVRLT